MPDTAASRYALPPGTPQGLRDFWQVYDDNYDDLQRELLVMCTKLPRLDAVIKQMAPEQLKQQSEHSRKQLHDAIFDGAWQPLLDDGRQQGAVYAGLGVPFHEWFELVSGYQHLVVPLLVSRHREDPPRLVAALGSMNAYLDIAMSNIGEAYLTAKERIITQQQHAIEELSTPVLQIRDRMLLVPLVGVLDTQRARLMTEQLLHAIRAHRARVVVIDITGVPAVDSRVANHLFQTVAAARLMGARSVVTGLSAEVAQALVVIGVDLDRLNTIGDLQGGLEEAERMLGYRLVRATAPPPEPEA
jgi:rsbT co-antagonist protein RsbR